MMNKKDIPTSKKQTIGEARLSECKKSAIVVGNLSGKNISGLKANETTDLLMAICMRLGISDETGTIRAD